MSGLVVTTARPGLLAGFDDGRRAALGEGEPAAVLGRWRARLAYRGYACTPELAAIGAPLGYSVVPLDDELRARRILVAALDEGPGDAQMAPLDAWLPIARAGAVWANASRPQEIIRAVIAQRHDGPFPHFDVAYLFGACSPTIEHNFLQIFRSPENRQTFEERAAAATDDDASRRYANAVPNITLSLREVSAALRDEYVAAFGASRCLHAIVRTGAPGASRLPPIVADSVAGIVHSFAAYLHDGTVGQTRIVIGDRTIATELEVAAEK